MAHTIPMELVEVSEGKATYKVTPRKEHRNIQGGVHGGFCATALDTATGKAQLIHYLNMALVMELLI